MRSRRLIALLMCLVLSINMMTACGRKEEKKQNDNTQQVTPEPTNTPKVTPEPSDKQESTIFDYEKGIDVTTLRQENEFDNFLNEVFISLVTTDSFTVHFKLQNPEEHCIDLDYSYGDPDTQEQMINFINTLEEGLEKFDYDNLTESQQIVYELLEYELNMYYQGEAFDDIYIWNLAQNNNLISGIQSMFTEYSIQDEQDAEDFTELLSMFPEYLKEAEDLIQEDVDAGACLTEAMLDMSIEMAEDWLSDEPEDNVIYVAFEVNLQEAGLEDSVEDKYLDELANVIEEEMIPAIEGYIDYLETLEDELDEAKGLWNYEGGKEYYAWLLESYLGAGMTPDELYTYVEGAYEDAWDRIMEIMDKDPMAVSMFSFADSKYSDDPEEIMEALAELAEEKFPDVGEPDWIISYLDERQEVDSVAAYYLSPQLDNIGRRVIRVNGSNVSDSVYLFATLAHEGIPGHLYQDEYTLRSEGYQEINSTLTYLGYQEGWAMYVEKLAFEWCMEKESYGELWHLNNILSYLLISMADIGVNYMEWTYEDYCEWMEAQGYNDKDTITYIYDMVVSDPGLYPAYGIGFLLMEDTVEALLETGCTEKEAYKQILDVGSSPYTILWKHLGISPIE